MVAVLNNYDSKDSKIYLSNYAAIFSHIVLQTMNYGCNLEDYMNVERKLIQHGLAMTMCKHYAPHLLARDDFLSRLTTSMDGGESQPWNGPRTETSNSIP